ncbi:MAG TPA: hypothetical protein VF668_10495 [Pyrinomonadaceae bacterium]|jgi:hypothetical protein
MAFWDFLQPLMVKAPELTYFDHLVQEFESLKTAMAAEAADPSGAAGGGPVTSPPDGGFYTSPPGAGAWAGAGVGENARARRVIADAVRKIEALGARRRQNEIDWNDLYLLELLLADARPVGALRAKVLSVRRDYRSVAGQVEYDEYLAGKPKNLLDPPDPHNPPDQHANYEQLLREDLKDLLCRLFKRYAILPVRESRLKRLTIYASLFCGLFLLILIGFILSMDAGDPPADARAPAGQNAARAAAGGANANSNAGASARAAGAGGGGETGGRTRWPSIALFVVLVSGAMGGFVSALQRIQSSPTDGDSMYNLAMLYHGSYAVFVAPLTGAIFGILLYMMFTGNVLKGRFFPVIYTPGTSAATQRNLADAGSAGATNTNNSNANNSNANNQNAGAGNTNAGNANGATNVNGATNTNAGNANTGNANAGNANNVNSGGNMNAGGGGDAGDVDEGGVETASATPAPTPAPTASLGVRDFLYKSGPAGGEDYALLIIWSFIAGFAERFVPDSLNRLIARQ